MKKVLASLLACALLLLLSACDPYYERVSREAEAMDTFMTFELYGVTALTVTGLEADITWYDAALSVTNAEGDGNEIYRVNQNGGGTVSPRVAELTEQALALCRETGGALDITIAPVVAEWGFYGEERRVPSAEQLRSLLPLVDYRRVKVAGEEITLEQQGMQLDYGAVAKGWLADRAFEILNRAGAKAAILNYGGTIGAFHQKPDGSAWKIGVADPENSADYMGFLSCRDKIVATSGSYERCFTAADGKTYSHLIDPKTGVPADSDILSVTIISDSGLKSDGLSTALFIMGLEGAEAYYRAHRDFDFIILTKDKTAHVTKDAAESFQVMEGAEYRVRVVS